MNGVEEVIVADPATPGGTGGSCTTSPPPPGNTSPAEYPGMFVELDESELAAAFPQGLPEQGGIYGLLCHEVLRGDGENAGKIGVGFRYVLVARINVRPSGIIVPPR